MSCIMIYSEPACYSTEEILPSDESYARVLSVGRETSDSSEHPSIPPRHVSPLLRLVRVL